MKKAFKIFKFIFLICSAISLLLFLIIAAIPITRQALLYFTGTKLTLYGYNDLGPKITKSVLTEDYWVFGQQLRSFSVQNTKNGNYYLAIDALNKAVEKDKTIKEYYGWVLLYYYREYKKAYLILDEYDKLTPDFSDPVIGENVNYLKGLALLQMGKYENAIKEFDIYINYVTESSGEDWIDVYAFVERGNAYFALNNYDKANENYNLALKYYSNCSEAYYFKAKSFLELNRLDSAMLNAIKSNDLILNNHKHGDVYIEYFHEIYPIQVERLIQRIKLQKESNVN